MDKIKKAAGNVKAAVHPNTRRFNEAVEKINVVDENKTSNADKLKLYALFQQAEVGDCNTERPTLMSMDLTGRAKWDAWKALEGKPKGDAMKEYADEVDRQLLEIAAEA